MAAKSGLIDTWLKKHDILFVAATRHPFIHSIRDGSVDFSAFKLWLGQDYLFVRAFVPFVASVLVKACKNLNEASDMEVILAGIAALNDEIAWFKKEAAKWEVDLANITPQKANQNYCRYLESLMRDEVDYPVAMTALWAVESVYHQSFAHCLEDDTNAPQELQEACQRWGSDGFGRYCQSLKDIANQLLEKASDGVRQEAEVALMSVLEHEVEFWNMSHRT